MMVVDYLAEHLGLSWDTHKPWKAHVARKTWTQTMVIKSGKEKQEVTENVELILLKPKVLMNLSGVSVAAAVRELNLPISNLLVLHDDMQRDLAKMSFKLAGSANGHNGIKSIISLLKTAEFQRLRIGIGRPPKDDRSPAVVSKFVLGKFRQEESDILASHVYPLCAQQIVQKYNLDLDPSLTLIANSQAN
ncbi:peptidyl-tRNA hydrolase [Basidiobolus meristosporus CBS 931.73]|uniref:peptidyl-tRNA hydrolase n=1 Tax=Basidiobolus meristosporus CBS 931.73 TaxID=1314790 RepID=A0A1Y1YP50_9FUNG|nr:peptidyl-tRNA hydrolase [Basidiobolus meristosporus CBS 931.73]|eukprot:ORX99781.1 peptidyl-tRNA hydrolase [Basidiobolus meristosporus CBS 931.73]